MGKEDNESQNKRHHPRKSGQLIKIRISQYFHPLKVIVWFITCHRVTESNILQISRKTKPELSQKVGPAMTNC